MDQLVMKWDYDYDKEGTRTDEDHGEERYELAAGAAYPLPHIGKKSLELRSVTRQGDRVCAEVYTDYSTYTVVSGREPVLAHVSDSYSVCGDSVHQSLKLLLSIETK